MSQFTKYAMGPMCLWQCFVFHMFMFFVRLLYLPLAQCKTLQENLFFRADGHEIYFPSTGLATSLEILSTVVKNDEIFYFWGSFFNQTIEQHNRERADPSNKINFWHCMCSSSCNSVMGSHSIYPPNLLRSP